MESAAFWRQPPYKVSLAVCVAQFDRGGSQTDSCQLANSTSHLNTEQIVAPILCMP